MCPKVSSENLLELKNMKNLKKDFKFHLIVKHVISRHQFKVKLEILFEKIFLLINSV